MLVGYTCHCVGFGELQHILGCHAMTHIETKLQSDILLMSIKLGSIVYI